MDEKMFNIDITLNEQSQKIIDRLLTEKRFEDINDAITYALYYVFMTKPMSEMQK